MGFLRGFGYGASHALVSNALRPRRRVPIPNRWPPATAAAPPPLVRLGVCGIQSLRHDFAIGNVGDVLHVMYDEHGGWPMRIARHVDVLSASGVADSLVVLGDHALLVQCQIKDPWLRLPDLVARVDGLASATSQLTDGGTHLTAVVCLTDSNEEPRELPGPSGRAVIVTGLGWLPGIARRAVLPGQSALDDVASRDDGWSHDDGWMWPGLDKPMAAAIRAAADLNSIYLSLLPDLNWWVVPGLQLDDGVNEPIELAAAGPTGAFVLQPDRGAGYAAQERALRDSRRLHAYLPWVDCIPVVIDPDSAVEGSAITDGVGRVTGWILRPDKVAGTLQRSPTRGVDARTTALLNAPMEGWSRTVGGDSGTLVSLDYRVPRFSA